MGEGEAIGVIKENSGKYLNNLRSNSLRGEIWGGNNNNFQIH